MLNRPNSEKGTGSESHPARGSSIARSQIFRLMVWFLALSRDFRMGRFLAERFLLIRHRLVVSGISLVAMDLVVSTPSGDTRAVNRIAR